MSAAPGAVSEQPGCRPGRATGSDIVTAELDPSLAEAVSDLFADDPRVEVITGDWGSLRDHAPFSLLFLDVRDAKHTGIDAVAELLGPGGLVVLDDFTPCQTWPPMYEGRVDTMRQQWFLDDRFTTVEVMVAPDSAVLIAARTARVPRCGNLSARVST